MHNKPEIKKFYPVECAIFTHHREDGREVKSYKFQKSYKKDGEWKNTEYFNEQDLLKLGCLVNHILNNEIRTIERDSSKSSNDSELDDNIPF